MAQDASLEAHARHFSRQYGTTPEFCERYLNDRYSKARVGSDVDDFLSGLSPTERLYLEYAFATNIRGREALARFPAGPRARRILDIGCGYGGTLKAFSDAGDEAVGLEIDPTLVEYARLNLRDSERSTVLCEDIVSCEASLLGQFDLIFCSDVIEHVSNPEIVLARIHSLLLPGGTFIMHVPNKDSIQQVLSDEHFCLFGFTLLSRQEGRELKRQKQGWDDPFNHMGQLLPLDYYLNCLVASGLTMRVEHARGTEGLLARMGEAFHRLDAHTKDEGISWFTRRQLVQAFASYCDDFMKAFANATSSGCMDDLERRFVAPTWTIIATRRVPVGADS